MTDKQAETKLRQQTKHIIQELLDDGWEEIDIDFDDCEVRIVFGKNNKHEITVQVMYQWEDDNE